MHALLTVPKTTNLKAILSELTNMIKHTTSLLYSAETELVFFFRWVPEGTVNKQLLTFCACAECIKKSCRMWDEDNNT